MSFWPWSFLTQVFDLNFLTQAFLGHGFLGPWLYGGGGGIRTPGERQPTAVFKTAALDHSATPPGGWQGVRDSNPQPTVLETATLPIELTPCTLTPTTWTQKISGGKDTFQGKDPPLPRSKPQAITSATRPAPMVRPPSRMAKRRPFSMATGAKSSTSTETLSPGMTISTPSGSVIEPVTSEVRK